MRKYTFLVLALAALFGLSSLAYASTQSDVTAKVGSKNAGTKKKPKKNKLTVTVTTTDPADGKIDVANNAKVYLPKGWQYNGKYFPKCNENEIAEGAAKCKKAIVGDGSAQAQLGNLQLPTTVTAYNGGTTKLYLRAVPDENPALAVTLTGTLKKTKGNFGHILDVDLSQTASFNLTITEFITTVGNKKPTSKKYKLKGEKKKRKVYYAETTGCFSKKWQFRAVFTYKTDPQYQSPIYSVPCKK